MFRLYRDLILPNPLWEEQAIYGGYRWIALDETDTVWVSRKWEPYLVMYNEQLDKFRNNEKLDDFSCTFGCMRMFKDMLSDFGIMLGHEPTYLKPDMSSMNALVKSLNVRKYATDVIFPSTIQADSQAKLKRILKGLNSFGCIGYNEIALDVSAKTGAKVFSDCAVFGEVVQRDELLDMSGTMKILIPKSAVSAKSGVKNWANVIVY